MTNGLDRATKLTVMLSAVAALAFTAYLTSTLLWVSVIMGGGWLAGRLSQSWVRGLLLGSLYVFPAISLTVWGRADAWSDALWQAALVGVILSAPRASHWSMPGLWRVALGTWALTVALCWPVVILREVDFSPSLFFEGEFSRSIIAWAPIVAATHILGVLWFDSLFGCFQERAESFERSVVWPLAAGAVVSGFVAVYQLFGDVAFLNPTVYAYYLRASGTMVDGNVYGVLAALWISGLFVLLTRTDRALARGLVIVALVVSALGCWASASRTGLLAAAVGVTVVAVGEWRRCSPRVLYAATGVLVLAPLTVAILPGRAAGPVSRILNLFTTGSGHSVSVGLFELWNRNWYGTVANWMIARWPVVGVGVGSFNALAPSVADFIGHGPLPPDNAQNWFRHQLAEFGLLGSLVWIVGFVLLARLLLVRYRGPQTAAVGAVRGALLGLGCASLFGMPTQSAAVLLTFWTFVFWFALLCGTDRLLVAARPAAAQPVARWVAGCAIAMACAVATAYVGWTSLRPPLRALRLGLDYDYGFYQQETDQAGHPYRWTRRHALVVLPAAKSWLRLTFSVNHADVAARPVAVTIKKNAKTVISTELTDMDPVIAYLHVPDGQRRIMVETIVSRVVRPSDSGATDTRELGMMVDWDFVDVPDPAARLMVRR